MPEGIFSRDLQRFYSRKSVLPSWKFVVDVLTEDITFNGVDRKVDPLVKKIFKILSYHHVVDVTVPSYKFNIEKTMYGAVARTFPTLSHDGFVVTITYEDDANGDILLLIQLLQQTIMKTTGLYTRLNENRVGDIHITLYNYVGRSVCTWKAKNAYFLGSDDITLSYTNNDTLKYPLRFGCDVIEFEKDFDTESTRADTNLFGPITRGIGVVARNVL
tara:strand:- start:5427 stop:6077 length:651 start_codon:yes stop_codon:yes gene_type:complete